MHHRFWFVSFITTFARRPQRESRPGLNEIWLHTDGPNDGGIDGFGINQDEITGLLQAKLRTNQIPNLFTISEIPRESAVLYPHNLYIINKEINLLDLNKFACRVRHYRKQLPQTFNMRIQKSSV